MRAGVLDGGMMPAISTGVLPCGPWQRAVLAGSLRMLRHGFRSRDSFCVPRQFVACLASDDCERVVERSTADERASKAPSQETKEHLRRCLEQGAAPGAAPTISLEAEVPEALFEGMRAFLRNRPDWDQYRLITSALAGFLFQNGCADRCVAQHYIDGLFSAGSD